VKKSALDKAALFAVLHCLAVGAVAVDVAVWVRSYTKRDTLTVYCGEGTSAAGFVQVQLTSSGGGLELAITDGTGRAADVSGSRVGRMTLSRRVDRLSLYPRTWAAAGPQWRHGGFAYYRANTARVGGENSSFRSIVVPHWLVSLLVAALPARWTFTLLRAYRRSWNGWCVACGYDLRGVAGRCPECVEPAAAAASPAASAPSGPPPPAGLD
jgi:hypothetical protein